jgi:hypothetical protein
MFSFDTKKSLIEENQEGATDVRSILATNHTYMPQILRVWLKFDQYSCGRDRLLGICCVGQKVINTYKLPNPNCTV